MKRTLLTLLCLCILIPPAFSQLETIKKAIPVQNRTSPAQKTILTEYPIYNQARIINISWEIIPDPEGKESLKISGRIENRLPRDLTNASAIIEFFNKDDISIEKISADVQPRTIKKNARFGLFSSQIKYTPDITSCKIDLTWQGKESLNQ